MERIPIPPRIWWREFSVSVLPPAVFAGGLVVAVWLWLSTPGAGVLSGLAEGLRSIVLPIPDDVHVRPGEMVDLRPDPDALEDSNPTWSPTPSSARVESSGSTRTLRSP